MWLPWKDAIKIAAVALPLGLAFRNAPRPKVRIAAAMLRETTVVLVLYAIWFRAGSVSVLKLDGAEDRGRRIVELQRTLHIPSETWIQRPVLPHRLLVEFCNAYYAIVHVPALVIFLIWSFLRYRDSYARWRTTMAITTAICLVIQLLPVAPPRMLDDLGFIDTANLYKQSVYSVLGRGVAGQLAAMPSVHVAWAAVIGWGAWEVSHSRWRWIGLGHTVLTIFVVTATANHYWLDGIVAILIIAMTRSFQDEVRKLLSAHRSRTNADPKRSNA
jgi:hypothetical protein